MGPKRPPGAMTHPGHTPTSRAGTGIRESPQWGQLLGTDFFFLIILFIYDLAALGLSCGTWDLVP